MTHAGERDWHAALVRGLRDLAAGADGTAVLTGLLQRLGQDLGAASCAVAAREGGRLACHAAIPSAEAALAGLGAASLAEETWAGLVVRRGPDALVLALRPGPGGAPDATGRERMDDVLALAALAAQRAPGPETPGFPQGEGAGAGAPAGCAQLAEELALARRRADLSLIAMGLGHDLNNLLGAVSGAASLIEADGSPMARSMAGQIATAVDQAAALVKRLMALGRPGTEKGWADLRAPLQDAAALVRGSLRAPLRLELALPEAPMTARIDPTGIMQMALNLCLNARDALVQSPPAGGAGLIRLGLALDDPAEPAPAFEIGQRDPSIRHARITVTDNGPGMDAETRARVFTPYFSTKGDRGTGLGVPVAAEVVKDHRGALALETAPGQGARFTIFLPIGGE